MTTIIGLDPSLSASGLAVWKSGDGLILDTVRSSRWADINGWEDPARFDRVSRAVMSYVEPGQTIVTIESIVKPSQEANRGLATLDLAQLRGAVVTDLYRAGVPINQVHLATLKKFAVTGNAPKSAMVAAARKVLGTKYPIEDDNQADAFWLLAMTLQAHGVPVVPRNPRRDDAVARIQWWKADLREGRAA